MALMCVQVEEVLGSLKKKGEQTMCAYEFYWFDKTEKAHLVGILQEEREDPLSITRQSILDLGRKFVGDDADVAHLYFIQVEV